MIRSSTSLHANDVSVMTRVRRSKTALNPQYEDAQEMTCTMRNWETSKQLYRRRSTSHIARVSPDTTTTNNNIGPELFLTPVIEYLTNHRDDSPVRHFSRKRSSSTHSSSGHNNTPPVQYSIPLSDIMVVETYNARYGAASNKLTITTISWGVFEFECHTSNGHDILLAFLQASLAPERILDGTQQNDIPCVEPSASYSSSCLDVDGFTDRQIRGRLENETWPEKISRRVGRVLNSVEEITGALCDVTACCSHTQQRQPPEPRERPNLQYHDLEFDEREEDASPSPARKKTPPHYLPSGLSMESEENPELEATR